MSEEWQGWVKIDDAPLAVMGFVWHRSWRSPFPGMKNGDMGAVWIDTCDTKATGYQSFADWWRPFMSTPERDIGVSAEAPTVDLLVPVIAQFEACLGDDGLPCESDDCRCRRQARAIIAALAPPTQATEQE